MEILNQLTHYGVPGLMLAAFLLAMKYFLDQHREERKQWYATVSEFTKAIDKFSNVLHEIKGKVE